MQSDIVQTIVENEDTMIPFMIFGIGGIVAVVAIVFGSIRRISMNAEREKTRREIAAYVAEGSMTPEDGARLLSASPDKQV
ncbi:MAG: hypothetical protein JKX70_04355 [Phycisphaerales bacterium]|nr:hypothetical protein [Phycisphaerales bacterium]